MEPSAAPKAMRPAVQRRLLMLTREFYATVAADFDATRQGAPVGMIQSLAAALPLPPHTALRVLDVGCGNARLLQALARAFAPEQTIVYWGVERDPSLLAYAQAACARFDRGPAHAVQGDILDAHLGLAPAAARALPTHFDIVACYALLHHLPGVALRVQALQQLAHYLAPQGRLLLSTWQFEQSARLRGRIVPWERIGLRAADVEPGDALLPWDQGVHALRYAHMIDPEELDSLAATAGLTIESTFFADGHEGNLNLYAALARKEQEAP